jgi:hypothetical protein
MPSADRGVPAEPPRPEPSARARDLVHGAYDVHVHVLPDVLPRVTSDLQLARRCLDVGLAGYVLKSHYTMTAERAIVVSQATGADVVGAITLNWAVGGINPLGVEICARLGGRFVWMPTADAANDVRARAQKAQTGKPAGFIALQGELEARGLTRPPIEVLDGNGQVSGPVRDVLRVVVQNDMVLCTGHLSGEEIVAVVQAARREGVRRIVITHPDFPTQSLGTAEQASLAEMGCLLERCFGTPHAGRVAWETVFANIRACGPARTVISSDLGQPHNPPVEDGLALMADRLLEAGFTDEEVRIMTVTNSRSAVGAEVVP